MRILAREKAETLGSLLTSGFASTGVCDAGISAVSTFCGVTASKFSTLGIGISVSAGRLWTFDFGLSTIEYPPFLK
ncbi:hypothetical protein [Flavobacterium chungangense]|uniref:hypothetical protein n=1 Tax=Flavobacterium chungangense TaxID=554283 RepID=UPI0004DFA5A5|nr:hypothetical protein [Flavobacterium chungangense]